MINPTIEQELHEQLSQLAIEQQRQVLNFARALALATPRGVPGSTLLRFSGAIEADELAHMAQAIEADCEQVNPDEW